MKNPSEKILFVYNADSGIGSKAVDFLHKALSPSTYQCSLCAITYGTFSMKQEWKAFIEQLPYKVEFWYKNDFIREVSTEYAFPAILLKTGKKLHLLVGPEEMEKSSLGELKKLLSERLAAHKS